jgi:hypothetical protein
MDSQAGNPASKKSRLIPLSEHPQMDRLKQILEKFPPDRQEAFGEWLDSTESDHERTLTEEDDHEQGSTD